MIAKKFRLKSEEIQSVLSKGQRIESPYFLVFYFENYLSYFRLGIIIGKKITKLSVKRNYIKRVIKAIFHNFFLKSNFQFLKNYDIVIIVKKVFLRKDFLKISEELTLLFKRITNIKE